MSVYGWWMWTHPVKNNKDKKNELKVTDLSKKNLIIILSLAGTAVLINGFLMTGIHIVLPEFFRSFDADLFWNRVACINYKIT